MIWVMLLLLTVVLGAATWHARREVVRIRREADQLKRHEMAQYLPGIWCRCHPLGAHPITEPLTKDQIAKWRF